MKDGNTDDAEHTIRLDLSHRELDILGSMFRTLGPPPPGSTGDVAETYVALFEKITLCHNTIAAAADPARVTDGHAGKQHH